MNKFIRYYNQNRKKIWTTVIVIVFVIVIIQLLNSFYADMSDRKNEESKNNNSQEILENTVEKRSEAMVQGAISSDKNKEEYAKVIEQFLDYCCNNKPEEAYKLLSNCCKDKFYPTEKAFETGYYNTKFNQKKIYDFQLWSAIDKTYIYLVKIYDDMLSSGIDSSQNYIQDYFSVVQEDNVYRLNISSFVKNTKYQTDEEADDYGVSYKVMSEKDNISIIVTDIDSFMDYETYHFIVINKSESDILLDTTYEDDTVVVVDENGNEFNSMLMELNEDDMLVQKGSTKTLEVKFVRSYISNVKANYIKFKKIIKNYEEYIQNKNNYKDFLEIKIDFK